MRLLHQHFGADPATLGEDPFRDYILHVKTRKAWKPKTIRQTVACARLFFIEMLGLAEWRVFSQIRTRDHDELPAVLTRDQVTRRLRGVGEGLGRASPALRRRQAGDPISRHLCVPERHRRFTHPFRQPDNRHVLVERPGARQRQAQGDGCRGGVCLGCLPATSPVRAAPRTGCLTRARALGCQALSAPRLAPLDARDPPLRVLPSRRQSDARARRLSYRMPDGPRPQGSAPQKAAHPQPVLRSPDVPALAPGTLLGFQIPAAIVQPTSRVITTVRTWPENGRFQTDGNGPDPSRTPAQKRGSTQAVIHESDPEEVAMAHTLTEMAPNKAIRTANRGFESDRSVPLGAGQQT